MLLITILLSSVISFDFLMELLFWKITKHHNLRESWKSDCEICSTYYDLKTVIETKIKPLQNDKEIVL